MKTLGWMKQSTLTDLHANVRANLGLYRDGDFSELVDPGWRQKDLLTYDSTMLDSLSGNSKDDLNDSLVLFQALGELPARLATHMNVWVPVIHTELLDYARKRWLKLSGSDDELFASINTHIFKGGIGGYRDDNAAGRLWWSGFIGAAISGNKDNQEIERYLKPFMRTTDTRSNVIERSGIFSERGLARNISEYLAEGRLAQSEDQQVFRNFMISINIRSNGRYFGDMSKVEVFDFLDSCS